MAVLSLPLTTYRLSGEEKIQVLGGSSMQTVVFNDTNLKRSPIKDDE